MTTASEAASTPLENATPESIEAQSGAADNDSHATLFGAIEEWLVSLRVAFARAIDITVLEARLAALNFALIVVIAVASGLLLATAWIALFAAIVAWLHEIGFSWSSAMLLIAVVNFVLAITGAYAIYRMSNNLLFRAIRKFISYNEPAINPAKNGAHDAAGTTPPAS